MALRNQFKKNAKEDSVKQRKYNSKPEQKKNRAERNKARRDGLQTGRVKKGDGKDIDHKTPLAKGGSNSKGNTRVVSKYTNRRSGGGVRSR